LDCSLEVLICPPIISRRGGCSEEVAEDRFRVVLAAVQTELDNVVVVAKSVILPEEKYIHCILNQETSSLLNNLTLPQRIIGTFTID
jgi:hypothetical protein